MYPFHHSLNRNLELEYPSATTVLTNISYMHINSSSLPRASETVVAGGGRSPVMKVIAKEPVGQCRVRPAMPNRCIRLCMHMTNTRRGLREHDEGGREQSIRILV